MKPSYILKQSGISPGTAALISAGVGGGLGYLIDEYYKSKDDPPSNRWVHPLIGAILAATPALAYGMARNSWDTRSDGSALSALDAWFKDDEQYAEDPWVQYNYNMADREMLSHFSDDAQREIMKKGEFIDSIGTIPVNSFNQVTWMDASQGRTPMEAAGFITNTLNQTSNRVGSNFVTPGQVINTMVNAGIGYGTSWLAGKTLGALAGVSEESQQKLREIGTWGGMLSGITNAAGQY